MNSFTSLLLATLFFTSSILTAPFGTRDSATNAQIQQLQNILVGTFDPSIRASLISQIASIQGLSSASEGFTSQIQQLQNLLVSTWDPATRASLVTQLNALQGLSSPSTSQIQQLQNLLVSTWDPAVRASLIDSINALNGVSNHAVSAYESQIAALQTELSHTTDTTTQAAIQQQIAAVLQQIATA
ncbi:UNVERIFIED_CONTAM: hypothetical protein HDU68_007978 [Siphonaria sp. JEL0065]|nr:hypothetical protein HDU68_007978 [Siphonaria sp. JEL0065]